MNNFEFKLYISHFTKKIKYMNWNFILLSLVIFNFPNFADSNFISYFIYLEHSFINNISKFGSHNHSTTPLKRDLRWSNDTME